MHGRLVHVEIPKWTLVSYVDGNLITSSSYQQYRYDEVCSVELFILTGPRAHQVWHPFFLSCTICRPWQAAYFFWANEGLSNFLVPVNDSERTPENDINHYLSPLSFIPRRSSKAGAMPPRCS